MTIPKPSGALPAHSDALFAELYHELHRLARREAARFGPAAGFSPTTLLHGAYMDMSQRVDLKFFCGFTIAEIAAPQNVSEHTVQRHWEKARLLLFRMLAA